MNLKFFYISFLLSLSYCNMVHAQTILYENISSVLLDIDYDSKRFEIFTNCQGGNIRSDTIEINIEQDSTFIITEISEFNPSPIEIFVHSNGIINFKGDTVICYDKKINRIYKFLKIDEYTLKSIKSTAVFSFGEILKATVVSDNQGDSYSLSWKNGKKNGQWLYYLKNGCIRVEGYKDGVLLYSKIVCYPSSNAVL